MRLVDLDEIIRNEAAEFEETQEDLKNRGGEELTMHMNETIHKSLQRFFERQPIIDADLVSRKKVIESLKNEYNRKHTDDGLKLAWIEKAVNDVKAYTEVR